MKHRNTRINITLAERSGAERAASKTASLEAQISDAFDSATLDNLSLLLHRNSDGRRLHLTKGVHTEGYRYISSSTIKPAIMACVLDQVAQGNLSLGDRAYDVIPDFTAVGVQQAMTLHDVMSFRDGTSKGLCRAAGQAPNTLADWIACVEDAPAAEAAQVPPGSTMTYSTDHLDIAGRMAMIAAGAASWKDVWDAWTAKTGLFVDSDWGTGNLPAPSDQMNITAAEYMEFLCALSDRTILTPALCSTMMADHVSDLAARSPAYAWHGEDWHFAYGLWLECRDADWSCPGTTVPRVSTIGAAGQYAYIDLEQGYKLVMTASFDFTGGLTLARSMETLFDRWAR